MIIEKKFEATQEIVNQYAELTGDTNPLHVSSEYADRDDTFGETNVAHGALVVGWISNVINQIGDAENSEVLLLNTDIKFKNPLPVGDEVVVGVASPRDETGEPDIFEVQCSVERSDFTKVAEGTATIKVDPTVPREHGKRNG